MVISRKNSFFIGVLKVNDENSRFRGRIDEQDPYQNVTDPQHCLKA
jgi:hypothetical protein